MRPSYGLGAVLVATMGLGTLAGDDMVIDSFKTGGTDIATGDSAWKTLDEQTIDVLENDSALLVFGVVSGFEHDVKDGVAATNFQLLIDNKLQWFSRHEFHQTNYSCRDATLCACVPRIKNGRYTISMQWQIEGGQRARASVGDKSYRRLMAIEIPKPSSIANLRHDLGVAVRAAGGKLAQLEQTSSAIKDSILTDAKRGLKEDRAFRREVAQEVKKDLLNEIRANPALRDEFAKAIKGVQEGQ